jgi:hypothetical protein
MTSIPDVQYARSGDVAIAYQVVGDRPVDLKRAMDSDTPSLDVDPTMAVLRQPVATRAAVSPSVRQ